MTSTGTQKAQQDLAKRKVELNTIYKDMVIVNTEFSRQVRRAIKRLTDRMDAALIRDTHRKNKRRLRSELKLEKDKETWKEPSF